MSNNQNLIYHKWVSSAHKLINPETIKSGKFDLFKNDQFIALMDHAPAVVLVINHASSQYEYFSKNVINLTGYPADEFYEKGVEFGVTLPTQEHSEVLMKHVLPEMFTTFKYYIAQDELKKIRISYNFKIRRKDGSEVWVLQHMTVLETDESGGPLLSLIFMSDISGFKKDNLLDFTISKLEPDGYFNTISTTSYPSSNQKIELTTRELEIIQQINNGLSSKEISEKLEISLHTVNTHRKNIFGKLNATNTANLIHKARAKGII